MKADRCVSRKHQLIQTGVVQHVCLSDCLSVYLNQLIMVQWRHWSRDTRVDQSQLPCGVERTQRTQAHGRRDDIERQFTTHQAAAPA